MPTENPRINLTLEPELAEMITNLANQEKKAVSGLAKELILEALERREDLALSLIAKIRDTKKPKTVNHKNAWK